MSSKTAVAVKILDREYKLACEPGQEDNLKLAAEELVSRLKTAMRQPNVTSERAAILVGLNLAHELMLLEQGNEDWASVKENLDELERLVDSGIANAKHYKSS
ncbi:MAG: cell division protein ZapA [Gammaproteobacteria bacterium]|nr:cell division protein ZapA [Gammaproteobacteria bacterium]